MQRGQAGCKAAGRNQRGHLTGDLVERAAASGDAQFLGVLPEHDGLIAAIEDFFQVGVLFVAAGDGLVVVELGQGNEGRILSGINHGEVVVGLGISRLDLDRFAQCRLGGFALAKVV